MATRIMNLGPWLRLPGGRVYGESEWFAVFGALAISQSAHLLEHVAQMLQLHVLGLQGKAAQGIVGALDIEWVHFMWNTLVLLAVFALLRHYCTNRWLLLTAALAAWHAIEHTDLITVYLATGQQGTPGLLGQGGAIAGGLPLLRPDLHFLYNVLETVPLLAAFRSQLGSIVDPSELPNLGAGFIEDCRQADGGNRTRAAG
jgi:hypothetical protein